MILSNLRPTKIAGEEFNDLTSDFFSQFQIQPKGAPQCLQYAIFQEYPEKKLNYDLLYLLTTIMKKKFCF